MKYSIAITESVNKSMLDHLLRDNDQEDLCFALYNLSTGKRRTTAIITKVIFPLEGDRNLHGNVSFNNEYFDRVSSIALKESQGICLLHSHPNKGWQNMSRDDYDTESMLSSRVKAITGIPFVGLTVGLDHIWSARFWIKEAPKVYNRIWCESVRVVGRSLEVSFNDHLKSFKSLGESYNRTVSAWGEDKQSIISRLTVGVVGLGSVGSIVVQSLQKIGIQDIKLIDFDLVEKVNIDRLQGVSLESVGKLKVDVFKDLLDKLSVSQEFYTDAIPYSIVEEEGITNILDCDVIFSCVDMPWPRYILNEISYANYIPVIDGGIECSINKNHNNLDFARWKAHTVGVNRICLECLGQYKNEDVASEINGDFQSQKYIDGLPKDHFINRGENVFAFSLGLASMEIHQLLSLILFPRKQFYGPKEFDFNSGNIDFDFDNHCYSSCKRKITIGEGDKVNPDLVSKHELAEKMRSKPAKAKKTEFSNWLIKFFTR